MIPQEVKEEFLKKLEEHTILYMVAGINTGESPMWIQLSSIKKNSIIFRNSQNRGIWFFVPVSDEVGEYARYHTSEAYNYFRDLKYEYLKNNHPLVYSELK